MSKPLRLSLYLSAAAVSLGVAAQQPDQGRKAVVTAPKAMVSSSHPEVNRVALEVLKKGGNAVDAMIAAVILQPILEPQMSTLAGGLGALIYEAKTGTLHYLDAELDHTASGAPITAVLGEGGEGVPETSGLRIGVPGTVPGLRAAAERFGTLPWSEYCQPAIRLAEQGFPMYSFLYGEMAEAALGRLSAYPSGREEYLPDGFVPPVGATVRRPRLAATLRRLADEGPDHFTKGEWARRFVEAVRSSGGQITLEEVAGYAPRWEEPIRTSVYDVVVAGPPPPSNGGALIQMVLGLGERLRLKQQPHYTESARTLATLRRIFEVVESSTNSFVRDPLSFEVPIATLLSKDYLALQAALIDGSWPRDAAAPAAPPGPAPAGRGAGFDPFSTDTNHLIIADAMGNVVSVTHTVYGSTFGTGLVVDGVGMNSGNGFPGTGSGKGRRVVSPFPATMLLKGGKPWLAIGSPGLASRAVAIVLTNLLGFGKDLYAAIDAPRFLGSQPTQTFLVEARVPEPVRDGLRPYGILRVQATTPYNWHMGSVQAVMRDEANGGWIGAADPRRGGHAAGY